MKNEKSKIILKGVKVHNLKNVDVDLDRGKFIVFTGVSGSGKSSLAFDTIYVEGQRRYIESLSAYARRHLGEMPKPDAELISGLSPTIAIEQKTAGKNPRSTVGTMTGIYDFLRVLYARVGIPHCPISGEVVSPQSAQSIIRKILALPEKSKLILLAPYAKNRKGEFKDDFAELLRKGYTRARVDGQILEITDQIRLDGKITHDIDLVIDRIVLKKDEHKRVGEAVTQALEAGQGVMSVLNSDTLDETLYSEHAYSAKSGCSYGPLNPQDFSFNHPTGMCPKCHGLGRVAEFALEKIIDPNLSIAEDCCKIGSSYTTVRYGNIYDNLARIYGFDIHTPWKKLPKKAQDVFLYGTKEKWTKMIFVHPHKKKKWTDFVQWRGILFEAHKRLQEATSDFYRQNMKELMEESLCTECHGARIRPYPAATILGGKRIHELTALSTHKCLQFFETLALFENDAVIAEELLKEIKQRLVFLKEVGLHYLTLDRTAPTLSGGESQRVRLASQIGSGLSYATYILDEPSIGLHPRDNVKLLNSLSRLCAKGSTVIVVEHDEETIRHADQIVDVGPLAGRDGGEILFQGNAKDLLHCERSLTAAYLSGKLSIPIPEKRRPLPKQFLTIENAIHHNLKNVTVKIPLGLFIAITGVSGSGKSSLMLDILYPALSNALMGSQLPVGKHKAVDGIKQLEKVIAIDQSPIGRTPRSNPATYIKIFDEIRDLFASLPESQAQGYLPGRFSFNVKEGSCPFCGGMGMVKIDMDFMEDEWVKCEHCEGKRFDTKTLSVRYKNKNIFDVLEMTIAEAYEFFEAHPKIKQKLDILLKVGLDYLTLGQASPTLSGGEAQRIKLAKELSRPSHGDCIYILDEPTTGLHFHDIRKLIDVLQQLVNLGNTVAVIEHNMDLVKTTDWIIDLGPEGGDEGGEILAEGRPEKIAQMKSPTGRALKSVFQHEFVPIKKEKLSTAIDKGAIIIEGASQNNLKAVDAHIPHGKMTVCTGPSGSGKTSLAFETVYAEGQRRYIETLSAYFRQYVKQMPKPKVEHIDGLMAPIAIEQKSHAGNPRSTVGTITEAYDYLRVLFAHLGTPYDPETGEKIVSISKDYVLDEIMQLPEKTKLFILSPIAFGSHEDFEELKKRLLKEGFLRIRLNGTYYELEEEIPFDKRRKNELLLVIDRLTVSQSSKKRIYDALDLAAGLSKGRMLISDGQKDRFFNLSFAVPSTGKSYPPITPHSFSFNTGSGMCLSCLGLGFQYGANLKKHRSLMKLTAYELAISLWKENATLFATDCFEAFLKAEKIPLHIPLSDLSESQLETLLQGSKEDGWIEKKGFRFRFNGLNDAFEKLAKSALGHIQEELAFLFDQHTCPSCKGSRLNPLARSVRIGALSIADLCQLPIDQTYAFVTSLKLKKADHHFLEDTLDQVITKLKFLMAIGLSYISLDRSAPTLSGGEMQRIRLARQLGSGLTGCLYVLDEPTIGLHPHNNYLLNESLKHLRDLGNTLLLVEHDPLTIEMADYILDFGPKAGKAGGEIVARGTLAQIKKDPNSLTGAYLSGRKKIPIPAKRRSTDEKITITNGAIHNLKQINVAFPIHCLSCITGVSGSGKSSLMSDLLAPAAQIALSSRTPPASIEYAGATITGLDHFDKLLILEQNPIGQTIRADVSTYTDLLPSLRLFFSQLPEAKARGLEPKHFSFNHRKGMCKTCFGLGFRNIPMQFLPPVKVTCESCHGFRFNPVSLQVKYKDKHLGEILQMTVVEAKEFLSFHPKIVRILDTLISVGLDYLQLCQEIASLSGGEAQRLRLSRELSKRSSGKTLYLLDEPTIGLHSEDILKLLTIFHALVNKGNTIILIEHNLDIIANCDYVLDLGPEAGAKGGEVVVFGTPEVVAKHPTSYTAKYLKPYLTP
ncbi:MAG TPA: excinuclease ABC subunit UvrA [Rhabdochlamydiaceae bacterium]|nr:excinuclease ABC subunit UvrA [Rhabdochlamydiaceae bacterium]